MKAEQKHFDYLDALRDSGKVNMFGAVPYLMVEFDLSKYEAKDIWVEWAMQFRG